MALPLTEWVILALYSLSAKDAKQNDYCLIRKITLSNTLFRIETLISPIIVCFAPLASFAVKVVRNPD